MNCLICQLAELVDGLTSVPLERNEITFVIHHVPARVCPRCGDAYVEAQVAEALLLQALELAETGVLEGGIEYNIPS